MKLAAFALGCCLCAGLLPTSLLAAAHAQARVVVRDFDGPNGKRTRVVVTDALKAHSLEVVNESQASGDLDSADGRVAAARKAHISAFIEGNVKKAGPKFRVSITAYNANDGSQIGEMSGTFPAHGFAGAVEKKFWSELGSGIKSATEPEPEHKAAPEPAEEESEPEAAAPIRQHEEDQPAEPEEDTAAFVPEASPLDVSVGARFATRDFSYNDALPGLRAYELGLSPRIALHLHWYPAAHFMDGPLANLGLDLRGDVLVGVSSTNSAGQKFSTSSHSLGIGLRYRIPLGKSELGIVAGYGSQSFSLDGTKGVDSGVPGVSYSFARIGAELRWAFADPLSLQLRAAYLLGLSYGDIAGNDWFPHASGGGVEGEVGVGFSVMKSLELQAAVAVERHFFSFKPEPTDPSVTRFARVAGGALDQYFSLRLSVLWRL